VALAWEQVLVGRAAAFEVGGSEERELDRFLEECGDGYVEGVEVRGGFAADEDDPMGREVGLCISLLTVPLSSFLPRLSIFTWN
jgi:hypothetical protein